MSADIAINHFGEFFRQRVMARGAIKPVVAAAGLSTPSAYRFFDAPDPEPLRMEHYNKLAAAKAAGYSTWEELDAAWRSEKVVLKPRRAGPTPAWAERAERDGKLPIADANPETVIAAAGRLSPELQLALAKSLPANVISEAMPTAQKLEPHAKASPGGIITNNQAEALAAAQDVDTLKTIFKEVLSQLKARGH